MSLFTKNGFLGQIPLAGMKMGQRLPSGYQLYSPGFSQTTYPGRLPTGYQELDEEETVQIIAPKPPGYVPPTPEPSTITTPDFKPGETVQIIAPPRPQPPYQLPPDISSLPEEQFQELLRAVESGRPLTPSIPTQPPLGPPTPTVSRPIQPENVETPGGYVPGGGLIPETPPRYPTEPTPGGYSPDLQRQIESYDQRLQQFRESQATGGYSPVSTPGSQLMTAQEVEAEARRRHEEWAKGAGISPPYYQETPSETASIDCGPGMFWDGKQCRGSRPPGGLSRWTSEALTLGPSGASVAPPPPSTPTGGGYGGYQPPPPPPSGPMFGPNIMTGRVLGRRFPVVNL